MQKKDVRLAKWQGALRRERLYRREVLGLESIVDSFHLQGLHNSVTAAFKCFELDPKSPLHNELLLGILADVCFPRRSHKKKRWDDYYYVVLARCFEVIVRKHGRVSDSKAAELIQLEFPGFDHITADTLRRRLPEARKRIQRLRREMAAPTPGLGQLANLAAPPFLPSTTLAMRPLLSVVCGRRRLAAVMGANNGGRRQRGYRR